MPDYLFAYGTLRKDYDLKVKDRIRNYLQYVGRAKTGAALYDLGRYPGAVKNKPARTGSRLGQELIGDLFLLTDPERVLRILDRYEGIGDRGRTKDTEFVRKKTKVRLRSGKKISAWIYWYNRDPAGKVRIGYKDYLNYLKNKRLS